MKHGMAKRHPAKGLGHAHQKRQPSTGKAVIAYAPGPEYGIGPSGGLMRGYRQKPLAQMVAAVLGRRGE